MPPLLVTNNAVIQGDLDVISASKNKHILWVSVRKDNELCTFPRILNLQEQTWTILLAQPLHRITACQYITAAIKCTNVKGLLTMEMKVLNE